jgi:hypothetical protein
MAIAAAANPIAILRSIMMLILILQEHPSLCKSNSLIVIGFSMCFPISGTPHIAKRYS